jgi:hypothetical protein
MKTITKSYKVYQYDELSDAAKQKARETISGYLTEDTYWADYDGLIELSSKEEKDAGIKSTRQPKKWEAMPEHEKKNHPYYWQYAGLFEFKNKYFDLDRGCYLTLVDLSVNNKEVFRKFLEVPARLWKKVSYSFSEEDRRNTEITFYHENGDDLSAEVLSAAELKILDTAKEKFSDKIHDGLKSLKDSYEFQFTEEAVEEHAEANEYQFTEDGKIFR